jgi:hypothetical protein
MGRHARHDRRPRPRDLRIPVRALALIPAGELDRFYSPALFEETPALIPGSELAIIDRRGHLTVMRDHRFTEALVRFLSSAGVGDH